MTTNTFVFNLWLRQTGICFKFLCTKKSFWIVSTSLFLLSLISINLNDSQQLHFHLNHNKIQSQLEESHPLENECRFPIIEESEPDLIKYVEYTAYFKCPKLNGSFAKQQLNGDIFVFEGNHQCLYSSLSGSLRPSNPKDYELNNSWIKLESNKNNSVESDQFVVKCYVNNTLVFHDVFINIKWKNRLNPPLINDTTNAHKLNFVLLVLDSVSRTQFIRHMPKTLNFMNENDFQILNLYNKIGDNSLINLLPILAGKVYDREKRGFKNLARDDMEITTKQARSNDALKHADLLLHIAQNEGCATLWNDDIMRPDLGLMHYGGGWRGFAKPPADYYFRPYFNYLYSKVMSKGICVNGELYSDRVLRTMEQFSTVYSNHCHFSFTFLTKLTHDNPNNLDLQDESLNEILIRLKNNGLFENTVFILAGDHGQRINSIQKTYSGRIEERTPLMSIHLPQKYRNAFPQKFENLQINRNRLTSNFDVHETLRELMQLSTNNVGISLFDKIPIRRRCEHARIPSNFCICMEPLDGDKILNSTDKRKIDQLVQNKISSLLNSATCIKNYSNFQTISHQPYTINIQARSGSRSLNSFKELLMKNRAISASNNEIVEIEVDNEIFVYKIDKPKTLINVRSRVIFNRKTKNMRIVADPILMNNKCDVKRVENLCQCS